MLSLWCWLRGSHSWVEHPVRAELDFRASPFFGEVLLSITDRWHCTRCATVESRCWHEWVPFAGDPEALAKHVKSCSSLADIDGGGAA